MGLLFVLIILASGYLFSILHLPAGFRLRSTDGWVSYFYVGVLGLGFTAFGSVVVFLVDVFNCARPFLNYIGLNHFFLYQSNIDFSILKLASVAVMSAGSALVAGLCSYKYLKDEGRRASVKKNLLINNPFESILLSSLHGSEGGGDVLITLENDKVYVGRVVDHSIEHGIEESFSIVPFLSGYRSEESKRTEFTVNYLSHYIKAGLIDIVTDNDGVEKLKFSKDYKLNKSLQNFKLVVVKERVVTISYFDVEVYLKLQSNDDDEEEGG